MNIIIPDRSRWKVQAKTFPEIKDYAIKVKCDYCNRRVEMTVLDVTVGGKPVVHDWIMEKLHGGDDEQFTVYHHDGNGNLLYKKKISGVKLIGHKCSHDYEAEGDDLQDHELLFSYEEIQTINDVN